MAYSCLLKAQQKPKTKTDTECHTKEKLGERIWVMISCLHGAQKNSGLEGTLPSRGRGSSSPYPGSADRPHRQGAHSLCSSLCLHWAPWPPKWPQTSNPGLSLKVWDQKWSWSLGWFTFKCRGQCACLSPILGFSCLSKGQITLVTEKGSVYKGCAAASQGPLLQSRLLDIWSIL